MSNTLANFALQANGKPMDPCSMAFFSERPNTGALVERIMQGLCSADGTELDGDVPNSFERAMRHWLETKGETVELSLRFDELLCLFGKHCPDAARLIGEAASLFQDGL